jgi:hypothetical protein
MTARRLFIIATTYLLEAHLQALEEQSASRLA